MLGPIARTTAVLPLAMIHIACSATHELAADDPYANCVDLGDLSLQSFNQADAEQRMRARVLELGGDTLLFGVRGRTARLSDVPAEIVDRRSALLNPGALADSEPPVIVMTAEEAEQPDALETAEANAARRRSAAMAAQTLATPAQELWFYGAALRCTTIDSSR